MHVSSNNYKSILITSFNKLRCNKSYCDVTLSCDGHYFDAHRIILSTFSEYFEEVLALTHRKHPFIAFRDVKVSDLKDLLDFVYYGEVTISDERMDSFIKTAKYFRIKGLDYSNIINTYLPNIEHIEINAKSFNESPTNLNAKVPNVTELKRNDNNSKQVCKLNEINSDLEAKTNLGMKDKLSNKSTGNDKVKSGINNARKIRASSLEEFDDRLSKISLNTVCERTLSQSLNGAYSKVANNWINSDTFEISSGKFVTLDLDKINKFHKESHPNPKPNNRPCKYINKNIFKNNKRCDKTTKDINSKYLKLRSQINDISLSEKSNLIRIENSDDNICIDKLVQELNSEISINLVAGEVQNSKETTSTVSDTPKICIKSLQSINSNRNITIPVNTDPNSETTEINNPVSNDLERIIKKDSKLNLQKEKTNQSMDVDNYAKILEENSHILIKSELNMKSKNYEEIMAIWKITDDKITNGNIGKENLHNHPQIDFDKHLGNELSNINLDLNTTSINISPEKESIKTEIEDKADIIIIDNHDLDEEISEIYPISESNVAKDKYIKVRPVKPCIRRQVNKRRRKKINLKSVRTIKNASVVIVRCPKATKMCKELFAKKQKSEDAFSSFDKKHRRLKRLRGGSSQKDFDKGMMDKVIDSVHSINFNKNLGKRKKRNSSSSRIKEQSLLFRRLSQEVHSEEFESTQSTGLETDSEFDPEEEICKDLKSTGNPIKRTLHSEPNLSNSFESTLSCNKSAINRNRPEHEMTEGFERCELCLTYFWGTLNLKKHMKVHKRNDEKLFTPDDKKPRRQYKRRKLHCLQPTAHNVKKNTNIQDDLKASLYVPSTQVNNKKYNIKCYNRNKSFRIVQ